MSVLAKKLLGIGVGVVLVGVLIALYITTWATSFPQTVAALSTRKVAGVSGTQLTLQTVAAIGPKYSPSASRLGLLSGRCDNGKWVH